MTGILLGSGAAIAAGALLVLWVHAMNQLSMGAHLRLLDAIAIAATLMGVAAFFGEPGIAGGMLAGIGVLVGAGYLGLGFFLSAQSKQTSAVTVGSPLPPFSAPDENGNRFELASVGGNPVFLKFFRGHW